MHDPQFSGLSAEQVHAAMKRIFGENQSESMKLFHQLQITTQTMKNVLKEENETDASLSPARMRMLTHLAIALQMGVTDVSPSDLSRHLGVSRNTISALLNGLEEQGYLVREMHPEDRRQFRIRLTPAGEALVHSQAPRFGELVSSLFEPLSEEEKQQLSDLTERLLERLAARASALGLHSPATDTEITV